VDTNVVRLEGQEDTGDVLQELQPGTDIWEEVRQLRWLLPFQSESPEVTQDQRCRHWPYVPRAERAAQSSDFGIGY
jgi:hypothetical protein